MWPLHSMLFIPAHKLDWVRNVARFAPDSVVIDLEDAVPPPLKKEARGMAREGIALLEKAGIPAFVRINAWSEGGPEDVVAVATKGFSGVMLPKARDVGQIRELDATLAYAEGAAGLPYRSVAIMPLPETAEGLQDARNLAAASPRCRGIIGIVGGAVSGDVARAMGFRPTLEGTEQLYLASKMVLDSRAGGAPYPMASIIGTALDDLDTVRRLATRAKALGFSGAVLIHPSHVKIADEVFAPTAEEVEYYSGLIEAMREGERRGDGAVRYRGLMIDYAMLPEAEAVLREAKRRNIAPAGRRS
jgi:citrate lyase subunit beta/citryl-CoA lyase